MKKSTIILIIATVACLGLSVISAKGSVARTINAISEIGEVSYTDECKAKIDRAVSYYNDLDKNLNLQDQITNDDEFEADKIEYVRLAIKAAKVADDRKVVEDYSSSDVQNYITEAREVLEFYLTEDQYSLVENYADLTALESEYSSGSGSGSASDGEEVSIPMC